jgi:50S ribosomal protein L16 3-hydroxylase
MSWQLKGFDPSEFIQQYWQKRPCLIRQVIPDFQSPIIPEELAGLACEDEIHSRLVIENAADAPWSVSYGPFSEEYFLALPQNHYSLLVSECEKWIPAFADLLEQFRFIPDWRIDDLMISYAPPGGSVGPHSDEYDVFLLQAWGSRKWQYSDNRIDKPTLIPGLDLAIMQDFKADQEAILLPGDLLYLPPGVAHHGVAIDACMTISIGFRTPTAIEVLESFVLEVARQKSASERYSDPELETMRHFAEITKTEIDRFREMIISVIDQPEDLWVDSVGKLLSDSMLVSNGADERSPARTTELFGNNWVVNPESRMLYYRGDTNIAFYCNGQVYRLPYTDSIIGFIQKLCELKFVSADSIESCRTQKPLIEMLIELEISGALMLEEE